jgi:hypothetical protein
MSLQNSYIDLECRKSIPTTAVISSESWGRDKKPWNITYVENHSIHTHIGMIVAVPTL